MGILAVTWKTTMVLFGAQHSIPLLACAFAAAFADCTSSLLFWRFAGSFREVYISALAAGEGMSGVVTSLIAWIQGASSEEPLFSAGVYFALIGGVMCMSATAFHLLRRSLPVSGRCCTGSNGPALLASNGSNGQAHVANGSNGQAQMPLGFSITDGLSLEGSARGHGWLGLLLLQAWLNVLQNGVAVSCLALACKPYGRGVYQASQTASLFIDPLTAALGFKVQLRGQALIPIVLGVTAVHCYILALSLDSVVPPFLNSGGGALMIILCTMTGIDILCKNARQLAFEQDR